jgi:signal peptidase II
VSEETQISFMQEQSIQEQTMQKQVTQKQSQRELIALKFKLTGLRWLWLAALVFVADIAIKLTVMNTMSYGWQNRFEVLPFFNLVYVHNFGAAFSFLSDQSGWQRWLFTAIAIGVIGYLFVLLSRASVQDKWNNIACNLIIGGAVGNVFDRIVHGFVVDYLDIFWGSKHWPAFNLADSAICIGALLLVLEGFVHKDPSQSQ